MSEVPLYRLYILRAMYAFIVIGLATFLWPNILDPQNHWTTAEGERDCMLGAFSIACLVGIRFPLQMLPVLLWETLWKTVWLLIVPFPQYLAGHLDPSLQEPVFACSMVVLVYLAIPWPYVFKHYVLTRGERWWKVQTRAYP
jgi:hypothetical protein